MEPAIPWVGLAGLVLAGFSSTVGLVWKFSRVEKQLRDDNAKIAEDLRDDIARLERLVEDKIRGSSDVYRDTFAALRQKIGDVELSAERNFVSKAGFNAAMNRVESTLNRIDEKVDKLSVR